MGEIACPRCQGQRWEKRALQGLADADENNTSDFFGDQLRNSPGQVAAVRVGAPVPGGCELVVTTRSVCYTCANCNFPEPAPPAIQKVLDDHERRAKGEA